MPRASRVLALALGGLLHSTLALTGTASATAAEPATNPVQQQLDRITADPAVPGARMVTTRGRVASSWDHSGTAKRGAPRPIGPRERMRIGSNTKTFTAAVVLQLVAEDKVDLDASVERYLPGVVDAPGYDSSAITVRQLLQHTSGIPEYTDQLWAQGFEPTRHRHYAPQQLVDLAVSQPPLFAPGQGWSYSNTNYILAGMVVRRVTGHPLPQEVRARIIEPLGLHDTSFPTTDETIPGPHPRGYLTEDGKLTDVTTMDPSQLGAAAAMISSGADVTTFFDALIHGRVVPPAQLAEMQRTVPMDDRGDRYGLGLMSSPLSCGGTYWGHLGGIPGFSVLNGVTMDGRRAALGMNGTPATPESGNAERDAVDAALCTQ